MTTTLDISKFFTKKNEEEGIVRKIYVDGEYTGIKACVYGNNSNVAVIANEEYRKEYNETLVITDVEKKLEKQNKALAKRVAKSVKYLESDDGTPLMIGDKKVTEEDYVTIMEQSPLIANAIMDIAKDVENFLQKKND